MDGRATEVHAQVASLLHDSRSVAPDQLGAFLGARGPEFGMREMSVYVTDYEQRHLIPIPGSADLAPLGIENSLAGVAFTTVSHAEEVVSGGVRLWTVVIDGAARLGVMSAVFVEVDHEARSLAKSLAGVVAALLVTRGQCTDEYTVLQRSQKFTLAAEMQWQLLPPLSLDSGNVSVAGLIQPAYEVGGDCFDYAVNGDVLDFAVFDAMGHGLESSQLSHLAVTSYRHSRRLGLDVRDMFRAMDEIIAQDDRRVSFVTCILGRLTLSTGELEWINVAHPLPFLIRDREALGPLRCEPTLPAGLGGGVAEVAHEVLQPGDRLCCITDGVVDAHRPGGDDFGEERLRTVLAYHSQVGDDPMETVRQLTHEVLDHHGYLSDDTTVFLVEYRAAEE